MSRWMYFKFSVFRCEWNCYIEEIEQNKPNGWHSLNFLKYFIIINRSNNHEGIKVRYGTVWTHLTSCMYIYIYRIKWWFKKNYANHYIDRQLIGLFIAIGHQIWFRLSHRILLISSFSVKFDIKRPAQYPWIRATCQFGVFAIVELLPFKF